MSRPISASIVLSCLLLLLTSAPAVSEEAGPVAHTTTGDVRGVLLSEGVARWAGIPYAAPPVGELRWRSPAPPAAWSGVRDADDFAAQCMQPAFGPGAVQGSEDCLYLNVFAPAGMELGAGLPVMVHLHGGGNFFGRSYRDATALVERGVIVVTVGYRLGALGFAGHPALSEEGGGASGEYGVLDQIAALHWVQDNIAAFGGAPENVTLFGFSAGSFDAVAIASSPLGDGLFTRLAAQTESFWAATGDYRLADSEEFGLDVAQAFGCTDVATVLPCMRAIPADILVSAVGPGDVPPVVGGKVLPAAPLELIAADSTPVPILLGSDREEAAFWFVQDGILPGDPYPTQDWIRDSNNLVGAQNGAAVRRLYPVEQYGSPFWSSIGLITDAVYTCPIRRVALANNAPVYRYLYAHVIDDPVLSAFRAVHGAEDMLLWNDSGPLVSRQFSPEDEALASRMAGYWTNFAKTGNPNGPGLPLWPLYTATDERIKVLDEPDATLAGYQRPQCAFLDQVPTLYGATPAYTPGGGLLSR